jgi:hypothetical protein
MSIGWEPSMAVGAPVLDEQRRALVERADALIASIESGQDRVAIERALREFGDYSVRHFSDEEDCRLRGVCPALRWNGAARADLIKIVSATEGGRRPVLRALGLGRALHSGPGHRAAVRPWSSVVAKSRSKPGYARSGRISKPISPAAAIGSEANTTRAATTSSHSRTSTAVGRSAWKYNSRITPAWWSRHA